MDMEREGSEGSVTVLELHLRTRKIRSIILIKKKNFQKSFERFVLFCKLIFPKWPMSDVNKIKRGEKQIFQNSRYSNGL